MKKKRFTEEQIIKALKEHEASAKMADIIRRVGISEATFYNWCSKYGDLKVNEAKRLKELEAVNAKLKKLLAETLFEKEALNRRFIKKVAGSVSSKKIVSHMLAQQGRVFLEQRKLGQTGFHPA